MSGNLKSSDRIDTLLKIMSTRYPGQYNQQEIADFCGCDKAVISRAETSALKKLRDIMPEEIRCGLEKY